MIIKTKEFKEAADKILVAIGSDKKNITNLELVTRDNMLYLVVTNKEFYVSVKFPVEDCSENLRATVNANLFLSLISGLTTEEFKIYIENNVLRVSAGKSNYKLAMIYDGENIMTTKPIKVQNKTVEMMIKKDILDSILNANSKELLMGKNNADINELQKLYYIDENGCFTFVLGACLNSFTLEKPVKMLLNDRIVRLFKLFSEDVQFCMGYDQIEGTNALQTKVAFTTSNVYVSALITCDDVLINKIKGPCATTKSYIDMHYEHQLVISNDEMSSAISRLLSFTKNSGGKDSKPNMLSVRGTLTVDMDEISISDEQGNTEVVSVMNEHTNNEKYTMCVNLSEMKLVLDSCKISNITMSCGNHRTVIMSHGAISNLIQELA